ncbi:MAG: PhnD/SsuA/transferrin family substrate-binding protein [Myxococcales bacterium]|nr:PhnD/SsuA/transferrin family substrate-binding protein [Myxococcales bacterium]MCB9579064.1 PhnD/SsuA/transferrin family substrate-binding protein [Polyangiaceae bacterium]
MTDPFELSEDAPVRVGVALTATATATGKSEVSETVMRARLSSFAAALGAATKLPTEPQAFADYPELLDAMRCGSVDIAWLPPVIALRAASAGRALPIALPVRRGVSSFFTALFTQVGSAVQRPADLSGVRAAWVDKNSASGFLVIRAALRAQGLDLQKAFFAESFVGSHDAVVRAVVNGTVDVGATYVHHDARAGGVWRAGWGDASVHVVSRVGPIPSDVIAAGVHVPVRRIRQVQRALLTAKNAELGAAAGVLLEAESFVEATSEHLAPLEALLGFLEDTAERWSSVMPPPVSMPPQRGE